MPVFFTSVHKPNLKCLASFIHSKDMAWASKCTNGSHDPDHTHLGIVRRNKANNSCGQLVYKIWHLALAILTVFHGGCKIPKCRVTLWPHPVQRWLCHQQAGLAIINLQTKCEISNYSRYEDMKSRAKCTNWGSLGRFGSHSRSSAMSPFNSAHTSSYSTLIELCVYLVPFTRYSQLSC